MPRAVRHRYVDPLDQVWLGAARRIGLRVRRSREVYASTDGAGTLDIGADADLDADDCLAQMIFHELCHWLVQGPEAFRAPDWGLSNESDRDVPREQATLRVQAAVAGEYGLRRLLAPTTDFRDFYDRLPADPLSAADDESVHLAREALERADRPPWAPHLRAALQSTAVIAAEAARWEGPGTDDELPPLWETVRNRSR